MNTLRSGYDAILLDLDGTVYRGGSALPGAAAAVAAVRADGTGLAFVTNNASRSPAQVAQHLVELGVHAEAAEIVTSSQAAAAVLAERLDGGEAVLVVGTAALDDEIAAVGLRPVRDAADGPAAVVQGHSPDTGWRELAQACLAIRAGALWVACNVDPTLPTEHGELPGNGAMVAALRAATGREPLVAGKPGRPLVDAAVAQLGARRALMVGDRLDTDIEAACAAGLESLLVLSGVTDPATLLAAPPARRPTHLARDLAGLDADAESARIAERAGWRCEIEDGALCLSGPGANALDALRTLCARWWRDGDGPVPVGAVGTAALAAVRELRLGAPH